MALAWITGAGGLIGSYLVKTAPAKWNASGLTRSDVDLLDFKRVGDLFAREKPALIIHSAAISKNPLCDADPAMAEKVNVQVPINVCALAENIPLVFLSTDLVFDGKKGNYTETDQ